MTGENAPRIMARWNIPKGTPPGRVYFHESGIQSFSGEDYVAFVAHVAGVDDDFPMTDPETDPILRAQRYVSRLWRWGELPTQTWKFQYLIGVLWGNKKRDKLLDFFGFKGISRKWPGNPEIYSFIMENGVLVAEPGNHIKAIGCGDGLIILGEEEKYRRRTKSPADFARHPQKIKGLDSLAEFDIN